MVAVGKKHGTIKSESVAHIGRPFTAQGIEMVYGYIAKTVAAPRSSGGYYDSCDHLMGLPCGQRGRR